MDHKVLTTHDDIPIIRVSASPAALETLARNLGGYSFAHRLADPPEDDVTTTTGRSRP
jgi:hypothetical protein